MTSEEEHYGLLQDDQHVGGLDRAVGVDAVTLVGVLVDQVKHTRSLPPRWV